MRPTLWCGTPSQSRAASGRSKVVGWSGAIRCDALAPRCPGAFPPAGPWLRAKGLRELTRPLSAGVDCRTARHRAVLAGGSCGQAIHRCVPSSGSQEPWSGIGTDWLVAQGATSGACGVAVRETTLSPLTWRADTISDGVVVDTRHQRARPEHDRGVVPRRTRTNGRTGPRHVAEPHGSVRTRLVR